MVVTMTDSAQRINTSHFIYRFAQEERATLAGVSGSPAFAITQFAQALVKRLPHWAGFENADAVEARALLCRRDDRL
jgi:hypothetical protein